nr:MAG TPA: hypothetical protein [Caudoviricetes sp.]
MPCLSVLGKPKISLTFSNKALYLVVFSGVIFVIILPFHSFHLGFWAIKNFIAQLIYEIK